VACLPEVKQFLRDCFLAAYDEQGKMDHSKKISKSKAHELLKIKSRSARRLTFFLIIAACGIFSKFFASMLFFAHFCASERA
jgi:hypothetical protein